MAHLEREWRSLRCRDGASETTYYDDTLTGLGLRCRKSGGKSWTFEFRIPGDPRKHRVVYGAAGDAQPALAFDQVKREYHKDVHALTRTKTVISERGDPVEVPDPLDPRERRAAPPVASTGTVREALDRFFEVKLGENAKRRSDGRPLADKPKADRKSRLERWLGKPHGKRPIAKLTRGDVASILDKAAATGHAGATQLLQRDLNSFFTFCMARDIIPASPMPLDERWGSAQKRERWLSEAELAATIKGIMAEQYPMRHAYSLLLLTGMRLREVCEGASPEIDSAHSAWKLPPERTKNRSGHVLPLSALALDVVRDAQKHAKGAHILSTRRNGSPLQSLGQAWNKNGSRCAGKQARNAQSRIVDRAEQELGAPMKPWVIHDLRRTVRSHLSALRVPREVAEAILNHKPGGLVQTYDRYDREPEMRDALTKWADKLKSLGLKAGPTALPPLWLALPAPETLAAVAAQ